MVWTQRLEGKILCLCLGWNCSRPVCSETLYWLNYMNKVEVKHTKLHDGFEVFIFVLYCLWLIMLTMTLYRYWLVSGVDDRYSSSQQQGFFVTSSRLTPKPASCHHPVRIEPFSTVIKLLALTLNTRLHLVPTSRICAAFLQRSVPTFVTWLLGSGATLPSTWLTDGQGFFYCLVLYFIHRLMTVFLEEFVKSQSLQGWSYFHL
jgi:hypothetical protein